MTANKRATHWRVFGAELIGTALLIGVGLSIVILDFGQGGVLVRIVPSEAWRRLITGFLFGCTGAAITISPLGKASGAHLNPVVTLAFLLMRRLRARHAAGYVVVQLIGAVLGAAPLLAWGAMGRSVAYGATLPSPVFGEGWALLGEIGGTFIMVFCLFELLRHRATKPFAPALFPPLYAIMVWLEAPLSGASTNPARSFGPALISGDWRGGWIYWIGPIVGALLAIAAHRAPMWRRSAIGVAKVHHFGHQPSAVFHMDAD